ncbi:hypothetical protein [Massilia timonae]|uniref:Tyr recombinase domain-containing protein n=1 Tax=Massilia timonae CCUG 45783 TaxID=883126 RepID=K9DWK8_9BURK|nr:hypothetical protein [Massilia timonae]EKU81675.1 hypothetical protein HMPREF9710_03030 [Massilia timonae CCUG 45783]
MSEPAPSATAALAEQQEQFKRETELNNDGLAVISHRVVGKHAVPISRYRDDIWEFVGVTTNTTKSDTRVNFATIPKEFQSIAKQVIYRYLRNGGYGQKTPKASTVIKFFQDIKPFFIYLATVHIKSLTRVDRFTAAMYVAHVNTKTRVGSRDVKLSSLTVAKRLHAVEKIYYLSQYTDDVMPAHPWPESSAEFLSGVTKNRADQERTPLIPDDIFHIIFRRAWEVVETAPHLLDLRDGVDLIASSHRDDKYRKQELQGEFLKTNGWKGGVKELGKEITKIRVASYIVVASLSGCRNHEIAFLQKNACYSTSNTTGETYWWMRSTSTKTNAGQTEWMVPEAVVSALQVMERWARPLQQLLQREIDQYRSTDPLDPRIAEAEEHSRALFIGLSTGKGNLVRTTPTKTLNQELKTFSRNCGTDWKLASHQFRRKFANYAARSQFGDLRYLREHFKHWSIDMTLGYALNESQEIALYAEIQQEISDIKEQTVQNWLDPDQPLAGGYGTNLAKWRTRGENITLFKNQKQMITSIAESTAIRSNGHAWCTADDNLCIGNSIEPVRCAAGCSNAVIGLEHKPFYNGLYNQLRQLKDLDDIGPAGLARVQRDLDRCANVLNTLAGN